jgi:hypothetical protein
VGRALIIVYLAAPIDQASGNLDLATKRQNILSIMFDLGHCVYDPFKAWTKSWSANGKSRPGCGTVTGSWSGGWVAMS